MAILDDLMGGNPMQKGYIPAEGRRLGRVVQPQTSRLCCLAGVGLVDGDAGPGAPGQPFEKAGMVGVAVSQDHSRQLCGVPPDAPDVPEDFPTVPRRARVDESQPLVLDQQVGVSPAEAGQLVDAGTYLH